MFGINNIKKRLEFVENELRYQKELQERKNENKRTKKKFRRKQLPVINKNDLTNKG